MIFQAYFAEALFFKSRRVALSSSVQDCGLVNGERDREGFRGEGFLPVAWVVGFLGRLALVGGINPRGTSLQVPR